jgi:ankyrin repeat protein
MPSIEAEMFTNPLMKRIAVGDETAVDAMTETDLNMEEFVEYRVCTHRVYTPLNLASDNGHLDIVERLLQIDAVRDNAAAFNNRALINAAGNGHLNIVERLLQIDAVRYNAAALDNRAMFAAAANGHLNVIERLLQIETVSENAATENNIALYAAAGNGHLNIVERLLQIETVRENAAACRNGALYNAAISGHLDIVERLLQIDTVRENAAADNNFTLFSAAENGQLNVVERLLQIETVRENVAAINNRALRAAANNGHSEISYILAKTQWPNGINDIPQHLRICTHEIRKGEVLVKAREESLKEATQVFRWLQEGYTPTSTKKLYLPSGFSSKHSAKTTAVPMDVMRLVNEYSGTKVNIDTSRPTTEELTMTSVRDLNLLKASSSIMSRLDKARIEREEREHPCNERAIVPYRPRFN